MSLTSDQMKLDGLDFVTGQSLSVSLTTRKQLLNPKSRLHVETFVIRSPQLHIFRPRKTKFIVPRPWRTFLSLAKVETEKRGKPGGQPRGQAAALLMLEWALRIKQESEGPKV